jgi:hypothetical protein
MTQADNTTENRGEVQPLTHRYAKLEEIISSGKASRHQVAA